jgi:ferredoxin
MIRMLVDRKFEVFANSDDSVLSACENSAIFIKAECKEGSCKSCTVQARLHGESEWTEVCHLNVKRYIQCRFLLACTQLLMKWRFGDLNINLSSRHSLR